MPKRRSIEEKELIQERTKAVRIARDLLYPLETITKIKNAKSVYEIDRILKDARGNQ